MVQTSFHLLLIACLLACPLRCAGCQTVSSVDDPQVTVGCSCCSGGGTVANEQSSDGPGDCPDDFCDCGSCICNGAVTSNDGEVSAAIDLDFWVFLTPIKDQTSGDMIRRANDKHRTGGAYLSGRDARIAHQSWLI